MSAMAWVMASEVADCSSAAVAMERTSSVAVSTMATIWRREAPALSARALASPTAVTAASMPTMFSRTPLSISAMTVATSLVAVMVFSASFRTSSATTAKPRPASPARAASMAAFKARRLVWSAISEMTVMMAPMPLARSPRASRLTLSPSDRVRTVSMARFTSSVAVSPSRAPSRAAPAFSAAWAAFLATSSTVAFISSMAVAVSVVRSS